MGHTKANSPCKRLSGEGQFGASGTCPQASEGGKINTEVLKRILTALRQMSLTVPCTAGRMLQNNVINNQWGLNH